MRMISASARPGLLRARPVAVLLVMAVVPVGCSSGPRADPVAALPEAITVTSTAFEDGGTIPAAHTCEGADQPPPLQWSGVPDGARELVVLVEDPDAPGGTFVHWIVVGLDAGATSVRPDAAGVREGRNGFGSVGWRGPCPPEGDEPHRYVFTVVAADAALELRDTPSISQVRAALAEHGIARGALTGRFGRS